VLFITFILLVNREKENFHSKKLIIIFLISEITTINWYNTSNMHLAVTTRVRNQFMTIYLKTHIKHDFSEKLQMQNMLKKKEEVGHEVPKNKHLNHTPN
jgi:hypothetical protein